MKNQWKRPAVQEVSIKDRFWTPYINKIRRITLPYVLDQFEKIGYLDNYQSILAGDGEKHKGPPFSDGLILEALRGASDFLATERDPVLEARVDGYIDLIARTMDKTDGFFCTMTTQNYPDKRFGENDGDIVVQHDLYDHGALIEAAVSHYLATGKTTLLACAVRAANLICDEIGAPPKKNVVPGHSLPEEAFVKLYRLFRDHRELDTFAIQNKVVAEDYLAMAVFWYEARGKRENRCVCKFLSAEYNQDHAPFAEQRTAVGHAVRAALCYTGAAAVAYETDNDAYREALNSIWENVYQRKLHISGGIGTNHDIEGFDADYNLPNNAYLETCAAIGFAFWAGEMSLLDPRAEYYEGFERALYNNILAAVSEDGTHYFYENPLISDGSIHRWEWHTTPCCPPMLLKFFSTLGTYIYSARNGELNVHLLIGSEWKNDAFSIRQEARNFKVDSYGKELTLRIRIPAYAKQVSMQFNIDEQTESLPYTVCDGYAVIRRVWAPGETLSVKFEEKPYRVFANPKVEADLGRVAIFYGPHLMCAEAMDNGGTVDFCIAEHPALSIDGDCVHGKTADGKTFTLIPYYRWCRREGPVESRAMAVWLRQDKMKKTETLRMIIGNALYAEYTD